MSRIKLNLRSLTIPEKIARSQQTVAALTDTPNFNTPHPPLAQVSATINELETATNAAQAARQDAKAKTATQNAKEEALDKIMTQLVAHVESVAGDDQQLIMSAGLDVRAPAIASATVSAPPALSATVGDHDGEIDLSWDTVRGARSYVVERSPDPPTESSWTHAAVSTRSPNHHRTPDQRHAPLVLRRSRHRHRPKRLDQPCGENRTLTTNTKGGWQNATRPSQCSGGPQ